MPAPSLKAQLAILALPAAARPLGQAQDRPDDVAPPRASPTHRQNWHRHAAATAAARAPADPGAAIVRATNAWTYVGCPLQPPRPTPAASRPACSCDSCAM